jgi:Uncharacterized protein conserved in bacteria
MKVKPIPEGYHTVTPYLIVPDVRKMMDFLCNAFDAKASEVLHEDNEGNIRHTEMKIGDSMIMMGQARGEWTAQPASFYVYVPDCDAAYRKALAAGATSLQKPADQFYGDRHGGVTDAAGNQWWIGTHIEDVSPEEMERRAQQAFASK